MEFKTDLKKNVTTEFSTAFCFFREMYPARVTECKM